MTEDLDRDASDRPIDAHARDVYRKRSAFRAPSRPGLLHRISPVSEVLSGYDRATLKLDFTAGLTVAALALPSGIAYAELAGLAPVAGMYALLLPTLAYALFGSSRQLIIGPEGSIAALVAAAIVPLASGDPLTYATLAALLALLVGAIYVLAAIARLGWIADYFSRPVLVGYISGVAVVLIIGQLGRLTGIEVDANEPLGELVQVLQMLPDASVVTALVGATCLATLLILRRLAPRLPGSLIVVIASIAASWLLDLEAHGVAIVGDIPSGLPSIVVPQPHRGDILALLPAALGIFLVSYADQILTARTFAGKHGQHVRADQELISMGIANMSAGVTQAFSVGASGSRTAVNDATGGRTQLAGLFGAGAIILVLLFLTGPMRYLPRAVLGAVIVAAAVALIDLKDWRSLRRTSRVELAIAATTAVGVVAIGVLEALVLAIGLSIVDVVRRTASPHDAVLGWVPRLGRYADVRIHPSARITPGVVVYRLDDRIFFANASYVRGRITEAVAGAPRPIRTFVFDAEGVNHVDATGVAALDEVIGALSSEGIVFAIARMKAPTEKILRDAGVLQTIGTDHVFPTIRAAVDAARGPVKGD
jgi:SulP family sulfate permease